MTACKSGRLCHYDHSGATYKQHSAPTRYVPPPEFHPMRRTLFDPAEERRRWRSWWPPLDLGRSWRRGWRGWGRRRACERNGTVLRAHPLVKWADERGVALAARLRWEAQRAKPDVVLVDRRCPTKARRLRDGRRAVPVHGTGAALQRHDPIAGRVLRQRGALDGERDRPCARTAVLDEVWKLQVCSQS